MDTSKLLFAKPEPRKRTKARKKRRERAVVSDVRPRCVERDGHCRWRGLDRYLGACDGPSEWAHAPWHSRAKTRGMDSEERHTTADSFMSCRRHHAEVDGRARPRLTVEKMTARGCDGPLRAKRDGVVYEENE